MSETKIKIPEHLKGTTVWLKKKGKDVSFDMDGDLSQADLKIMEELGCFKPPKAARTVKVSR